MPNLSPKVPGAILYTRVSTEGQVKRMLNEQIEEMRQSLEMQREVTRDHAAKLGLQVVAEYEDAGVSGALYATRQGIQAALADIERGCADTLIVFESKRKGRGVELALDILKRLKKAKARLYYCDKGFVDLDDKLRYLIDAYMDEKDRDDIRTRLKNGKHWQAKSGVQPTRGQPPYGYHIVTKKDMMAEVRLYHPKDIGNYIIIEDQAAVIRRIFTEYAAGTESLHSLCRKLNTEGIPPARAKKGAGLWYISSIRNMMMNPVYKGTPVALRWRGEFDEDKLLEIGPLTGRRFKQPYRRWKAPEEEWVYLNAPAIVDEATWERAQELLPANRTSRKSGNPRRRRMLAGRAHCPHCGSKMELKSTKKWLYYYCGDHLRTRAYTGENVCSGEAYSVPIVENAVITALADACEKPEAIQAAYQAYKVREPIVQAVDARAEISAIDQAILQLNEEEFATVQAQVAGIRAGASPNAYQEAFAHIAARRKDLEDRRGILSQQLKPAASRLGANSFRPQVAINDVRLTLTSELLSGAEKRDVLGTVVDKVVCHRDGATVEFVPGLFSNPSDQTVQTTLTTSSQSVGEIKTRPCRAAGMCANCGCDAQ